MILLVLAGVILAYAVAIGLLVANYRRERREARGGLKLASVHTLRLVANEELVPDVAAGRPRLVLVR